MLEHSQNLRDRSRMLQRAARTSRLALLLRAGDLVHSNGYGSLHRQPDHFRRSIPAVAPGRKTERFAGDHAKASRHAAERRDRGAGARQADRRERDRISHPLSRRPEEAGGRSRGARAIRAGNRATAGREHEAIQRLQDLSVGTLADQRAQDLSGEEVSEIEFAFFQPGFLAAILLPRTRNVLNGRTEMFYGLTPLGVIHTAISLIAVAAGLIALARDKEISPRNTLGKVYV